MSRRASRARQPAPTGRPGAGYTLIELLVVLSIVGIAAGMVTLTVGDGGRSAVWREEAVRLRNSVAMTATDAIARGHAHGILVEAGGYRPLAWQGGAWQRPDADPLSAPRRLPAEVEVELYVRGEAVDLGVGATVPQLQFEPGGQATPFEIGLRAHGVRRWRVTGTMTGALSMHPAGARPP